MQYSPYYRGGELVFDLNNMEKLSKGFRLISLVNPTQAHYRKFVKLEVPSPTQPKHWLKCAVCLYRLGFGYDRIARYMGMKMGASSKNRLSKYFKNRRGRGLAKPQLRPRTPKPKHSTYIPRFTPEEKLRRAILNRTQFKAKARLRSYFSQWVSRGLYPRLMKQVVGCDRQFFRHWIYSQFSKKMTWDNHGILWHIDHKIPCKAFDLTKKEHVLQCWHFSNMRPLLTKHNLHKAASIEPTQNELLLNF